MFSGSLVALVTPMKQDGSIDFPALHRLLDLHLEAQTNGIVLSGSTGEAATLSEQEKYDLARESVRYVGGAISIIVGTNANGTEATIEMTRRMKELGVDACLLCAPYYIRPTKRGLIEHFKEIAMAVNIPQILYNHPGRTGSDIDLAIVKQLVEYPNIVGIKDASNGLERLNQLVAEVGDKIDVLCGDDEWMYQAVQNGCKGAISVAANLVPVTIKRMLELSAKGSAQAQILDQLLKPLYKMLTIETNPTPIKWLLARQGLIHNHIRMPLLSLSACYHEAADAMLKDLEENELN